MQRGSNDGLLNLAELDRELGTDWPLEHYLEQAGVEVIEEDGERKITSQDWRRFQRMSIHSTWDGILPGDGGMAERSAQPGSNGFQPKTPLPGDDDWNERRSRLLQRNPWLLDLFKGFATYVREHDPSITIQRHGQTRTFITEHGRRAGLRLRAGRGGKDSRGLWLIAKRKDGEQERWVRSPDDFAAGLQFLRELPGY